MDDDPYFVGLSEGISEWRNQPRARQRGSPVITTSPADSITSTYCGRFIYCNTAVRHGSSEASAAEHVFSVLDVLVLQVPLALGGGLACSCLFASNQENALFSGVSPRSLISKNFHRFGYKILDGFSFGRRFSNQKLRIRALPTAFYKFPRKKN